MSENQWVKISGIWKNKSKNGETYLTGSLGQAKVMVWPNKFKKEDKQPDFNMFILPYQKDDTPKSDNEELVTPDLDDEIPF